MPNSPKAKGNCYIELDVMRTVRIPLTVAGANQVDVLKKIRDSDEETIFDHPDLFWFTDEEIVAEDYSPNNGKFRIVVDDTFIS